MIKVGQVYLGYGELGEVTLVTDAYVLVQFNQGERSFDINTMYEWIQDGSIKLTKIKEFNETLASLVNEG